MHHPLHVQHRGHGEVRGIVPEELAEGPLLAKLIRLEKPFDHRLGVGRDPAKGDGEETCLYRYPTRYISTDAAYLYFDEERQLYFWEFEPAKGDI